MKAEKRGDFTLPGEAGYEKLTLELAEKWGADVIRDSERRATLRFPKDVKIRSTPLPRPQSSCATTIRSVSLASEKTARLSRSLAEARRKTAYREKLP